MNGATVLFVDDIYCIYETKYVLYKIVSQVSFDYRQLTALFSVAAITFDQGMSEQSDGAVLILSVTQTSGKCRQTVCDCRCLSFQSCSVTFCTLHMPH